MWTVSVREGCGQRQSMRACKWLLTVSLFCMASVSNVFPQVEAPDPLQTPPGIGKIRHVVFIIKENRSFDHYFGQFPNAYGVTKGKISTGRIMPLMRARDILPYDLDHTWAGTLQAFNGGKMNGFDLATRGNINGQFMPYSQMTEADIPNYWSYAQHFVLADHMFASQVGPSFGNHLYTIAAQGGGAMSIPAVGNKGEIPLEWGCDSPPNTFVQDIVDVYNDIENVFPCFDFPTLADNLEAKKISWKYYAPPHDVWGYVYSAYDAINHIRNSNIWDTNVVSPTDFITDATNGKLPAVSWLISPGGKLEHPPASTCVGENWAVEQVNAVMQGPDWSSTAIFIVWDEFGGFYDHMVPPSNHDQFPLGPRMPLLIISPWAVPGKISHTVYELSSVLKFIEKVYGLPALTNRDAGANAMLDSFNFDQTPNPPLILQTRQCPLLAAVDMNVGNAVVGSPSKDIVQLTNYSSKVLSIQSIKATGDFVAGGTCGKALGIGKNCTIDVTLTPTAAGPRTGTLTVTDSDPSSPQIANLTGNGTFVKLPLYPGLSFPFSGTALGSKVERTVTLTNTGSSTLTVSKIRTVGDYSETDACKTVAAGKSCKIAVTFTPTVSGRRFGNLVVTSNDPGSPQMLRMVGVATAVTLAPKSLNFGDETVGDSSQPKTVTLTNTGSDPLHLASIIPNGDYAETNNCGKSVAAQGSCTISVTFTPTQQGVRTGAITLNDSDMGTSPQTIPLTGTGD